MRVAMRVVFAVSFGSIAEVMPVDICICTFETTKISVERHTLHGHIVMRQFGGLILLIV
jgi:hypothetical protein